MGKKVSRSGFSEFLQGELQTVNGRLLHLGCGSRSYQDLTPAHEVRVDLQLRPMITVAGDAHLPPFVDNVFDAVLIEEMLEHCQAPHRVISEIYRVLKENGTLIMTVPFLFPLHDRPHDYFRFTEFGLRHLLGDFNSVLVNPHHSGYATFVVLFQRLIMEPGRIRYLAPLIVGLSLLLLCLDKIVSRLVRIETYTTGYFVVAVK